MSMKRPFQQSGESSFALLDFLKSYDCNLEVPMSNPSMTPEQAHKEAVTFIEQWSHEYGTDELFLEFIITKKIEIFCSNGKKTTKFFRNFLTNLLFKEEGPEINVFRRLFGNVASKKLVKYVWNTRYNLLSYLNKKEYMYKSLRKLYVTLDQAANLSPKFFSKNAAEMMENFMPELNKESVKIRNKVMISVSRWYEMLVEEYIRNHKGCMVAYHPTPKYNEGKIGFIANCLKAFDAPNIEKENVDLLLDEKREDEKERPRDNYKGENHAYDEIYEVRQILSKGKGSTSRQNISNLEDNRDEIQKKSFAINTYANYSLQQRAPKVRGEGRTRGMMAYLGKVPRVFLKNFREHESIAQRALNRNLNVMKKYDTRPEDSYIKGAFRNCINQKNRGKLDSIFKEN